MPEEDISQTKEERIDCQKMTNQEIEEWVVITRKVLVVLSEEDKETYKRAYQDYILDLQRLKDADRITETDYEELLEDL